MVEKTIFGTMEDGREVSRYTLTNQNGVSASFLDLGAIWSTMLVPDRNGEMADVLLGHETVADCLVSDGHLGEAVGRNANRIGGAVFTLNEKKYELTANDGPNNLHSGMDFYRNRIWAAEYETGVNQVSFTLESPDGDQGYPGNASIRVTYTLTDENEVKIHYEGTCDQDTIFNMTNHAYFNLAGHESGPALSQMVYIDSDAITAVDKVLIPTGEIRKVMGTPMDFSDFKPIGRDIEADYDQLKLGGGYDHNWILNHESGIFSLAAAAIDEESGRKMEVYTDLPGVQFYTGNFLDGQVPGKGGVKYARRQGYCFETQYYPNAVNMPGFASPIVKKGEKYDTTTSYKFMTV